MPELLLPRLKREIEARLAELRPLVAEAERLEVAKQALLAEAAAESASRRRAVQPRNGARPERMNGAVAPAASPPAPAANVNGAAAEDVGERAPRGANQTAILAIVEERPGVSVAEIAAVTKIAKPTVATTVSKLKREGLLADEAGGVKLASRQPVTLSQIAAAAPPQRDEGVSDEEWEGARRDPAAA
jgi:hypothetical protein